MSDFGTEVGNSGLNLMGKLMEALLKLLSKIFDTVNQRTSADYKLKKAQLADKKAEVSHRKFVEKIEGKAGFVNHRQLEKAGVPLVSTGITLDDAGMRELAERCKREGIIITGVEDIRQRELTGNKFFLIECRQSDLPRLASLVDLMNDEKKISKIHEEIGNLEFEKIAAQDEIDQIKSKGEGNLTQEDLDRIAELEAQIEENDLVIDELYQQVEDIRYGHSQELNQEQAQGVVEKAVNGETQHGVTFDEALDRWTGGKIDKDTTCYVVDAKDPERYIVCNAKNDTFHDQEYIKTDYEVYNGDKQVYATNDGRFEGRPTDYWQREKAAMRDNGGFSDLVIKFYSLKELEAYRESYKEQNMTELDALEAGKEGREYDSITKTLEAQLDECGGAYKDGIVVDKETGNPLMLTGELGEADLARVAEASVIGRQIDNYRELSNLESDIAIARANVLTTTEGTPEHTAAQAELAAVEAKYKSALEVEAELIDERKSVNAVQAEQEVRISEERARDEEREGGRDAQGVEKIDESRNDRAADMGDTRHEMAEYKGQIEARRSAAGAKANDAKDHLAEKATQKIAKPKDRGDR